MSEILDIMANFNEVPNEFRVFSIYPELRIKYFVPIGQKLCSIIMLLPFVVLFIGHCCILILGLYEILNLHFWKAIQVFSYYNHNPWNMFVFTFSFFLLGLVTYAWLGLLLGATEILVTQEYLRINYKILGISNRKYIVTGNIRYFQQFLKKDGDGDIWHLEIVSNKKLSDKDLPLPFRIPARWFSEDTLVRMNYKTINLYSHVNPHPSEWLGKVLADFCQVGFQSTARLNNSHINQSNF